MKIRKKIQELHEEIAQLRRAMHENPQTAYEEEFASTLVKDKLKEWNIHFEDKIATTGLVATIEGQSNDSGHAIGLRADMDALDINEEHNKPWVSKTPGKMHGCGHDGHTAMLLGAAKYLSESRKFNGKAHLIFQPAEEGGRGAQKMMEEGLFDRFPCDRVFGLHNWPQLPRGKFATCPGPIMAASDIFHIKIMGKGGHAAYPHRTIDPIVIGAHIITALQTLVSRESRPTDPAVITIAYFNAGTGAHNVIPNTAELTGTLRTYSDELRKSLKKRIGELSRAVARGMGGDTEYEFHFGVDATINDPAAADFTVKVATGIFGAENVDPDVEPSMGGEDFGAMMQGRPGCYVRIGQGEPEKQGSPHNYMLHTPRYDFNDDIIPIGIEYWARIVEEALPLKR